MRKLNRLGRAAVVLLVLTFMMITCNVSAAKNFPAKPITLIVPFSAGGISDLLARLISDVSKKYISQPINVVNRPGGSGTIGINEVVTSKPDGYTLGLGSAGETCSALHLIKAPYNLDSYTPICQIGNSRYALVVRKDAPWNNLKEFVDYVKKNPKMNVGVPGKGTVQHLTAEYFCQIANIDLNFVPFQGSGPVIPALLGGHVDAAMFNVTEILGMYKAKEVKLLTVFSQKRIETVDLKDVPTVKEQGFNVNVFGGAHFIVAPNNIPSGTLRELRGLMKNIVADEKFVDTLLPMGYGPGYGTTSQSKKFFKEWYEISGGIYQKLGMVK